MSSSQEAGQHSHVLGHTIEGQNDEVLNHQMRLSFSTGTNISLNTATESRQNQAGEEPYEILSSNLRLRTVGQEEGREGSDVEAERDFLTVRFFSTSHNIITTPYNTSIHQ